MEIFRVPRNMRDGLLIRDPHPVENAADVWSMAAHIATVGIFVILFGCGLYFAKPILMPATAALVVGFTLAPAVNYAKRRGVPSWASAIAIVAIMLIAAGITATLIAGPVSEWIGRGPEIGDIIKRKLSLLVQPLNALENLQNALIPANSGVIVSQSRINVVMPVLAFLTPAVAEIVVFFVALLFFLAGHTEISRLSVVLFSGREAKLRVIRIVKDAQHNLASYLATVTVINFCLGVIVGTGAWLLGMPNPILFGLLAAVLNYIPYIGPACVVMILFAVGLVTFSGVAYALVPPACFVGLTTLEGQIITPAILGTRLPLRPLAIFLSLAFWAWLWGPIGAFLAVPLAIIARVVVSHVFRSEQPNLTD